MFNISASHLDREMKQNRNTVLFNILKVAYRNLIRNKLYSLINVLGLAIGIASCQLALTYIFFESSYDNFHENADNIYRLIGEKVEDGEPDPYAKIPFPFKQAILDDMPEVDKVTRLYNNKHVSGKALVKRGEISHFEDRVFYVDQNFFEVFNFEMIRGNGTSALEGSNGIILTESSALKYFGSENPIGQHLEYNGEGNMTVTGVLRDIPENSHIQFDFLVPLHRLRDQWVRMYNYDFEHDWKWSGGATYILLHENASIESVSEKLPRLVQDHYKDDDYDGYGLVAQHFPSIYLGSNIRGEIGPTNNTTQLSVFGVVAALILLIAMVNFMNLSTARSIKRAREVGIRKVMGAHRSYLLSQFMGEAIVLAFIALMHAFLLLNLTLPIFNAFTDKSFSFFELITDSTLLFGSLMVTILTGFLSGIYPAIFLSNFSPIKTLRSNFKGAGSITLRKALVIVQFSITLIFILCIVVVHNQLDYIKNKDLGFNKEQILLLPRQDDIQGNFNTFYSRITAHSNVTECYLGNIIGERVWSNTLTPEGFAPDEGVSTNLLYCGLHLVDMFGLELVEGRGFDAALDTDSISDRSAFLINEAARKQFKWNDGAVGKEIKWVGGSDNRTEIKGRVVGVLEDFNYMSLYNKIEPLVIRLSSWGKVAVKIKPSAVPETLAHIKEVWESSAPGWNFEYTFLDADLDAQYKKEERLSSLIWYFAILAIFISCLGVFGLVAYMAEQRKREIAIRKTLGATIQQLITLLSSDYIKLIFVAAVIGSPIGYFLMNSWLNDFAYRVTIHPGIFAASICISLIIAVLTVSFQSFKAASENPVNSLRNE